MVLFKNNGYKFLDYLDIKEDELKTLDSIGGSYIVIEVSEKYLICFNRYRKQWEIPAGQRESDETSKQCAIRELFEETGQTVSSLEFKGLLKSQNILKGCIKYNPVYYSKIKKLQPFIPNSEISHIKLWDLKEDIGIFDELDFKIFSYMK